MLFSEKKEREYRFKLALRMGVPIFGLVLVLIFTTLIKNYKSLDASFYVESALLMLVSIYFIFYLIYKGFDERITDPISKAFTREYFNDYVKELFKKKKDYTFILVSIDNLTDINLQYGIKNGDKVLKNFLIWINDYLEDKEIYLPVIGRIKGGDFVIVLEGNKKEHKIILDLLCIKGDDLKIDNIELKISGAITDTTITKNIEHIIDTLFEKQELNRYKKENYHDEIDPSELESLVVDAIENRLKANYGETIDLATTDEWFTGLSDVIEDKNNNIKAKTADDRNLAL